MNDLHKAYHVLGLEPGTQFETVKRRYRRLILVWHPDRMTRSDAKQDAEEELKKINNSFEKLKKHFESEHKSGACCRCQPSAAGPPPNNSQHANNNHKTNQQSNGPSEAERRKKEEEATQRRTEERRKREAEEEAARRAAEAAQHAKNKQHAAEDAMKSESERKEEVLRWKLTKIVGIAFISLIAYCWLGCMARDVVHGAERQWNDFITWLTPKQESPPIAPPSQTPEPQIPPYIPPYERPPTGNITSWKQYIEDITEENNKKREKQKQQDIYFARLQIDRAQKAIDHCSRDIAQMELKLTDPFISEIEKNKIREMRDFQQRNLEAEQAELRDAQEKLQQSDSNWPFAPPAPPPNS